MSKKSIRKDIPQKGYERVIHITDEETGLDAIIAIHNTKLGPTQLVGSDFTNINHLKIN